jgi:hypothetical protein
VHAAQTASHFQRAVLKIGNYLILLAVTLVAVIITVALFRGDPILTTLQFALVLTVVAIPPPRRCWPRDRLMQYRSSRRRRSRHQQHLGAEYPEAFHGADRRGERVAGRLPVTPSGRGRGRVLYGNEQTGPDDVANLLCEEAGRWPLEAKRPGRKRTP